MMSFRSAPLSAFISLNAARSAAGRIRRWSMKAGARWQPFLMSSSGSLTGSTRALNLLGEEGIGYRVLDVPQPCDAGYRELLYGAVGRGYHAIGMVWVDTCMHHEEQGYSRV